MKITDLELEQYGIYQNESWKPAAGCLNVIMGENESGKTTLLRFIPVSYTHLTLPTIA